jgi:hypothetical protein
MLDTSSIKKSLKSKNLTTQDLNSIASFNKIVLNYLKMKSIIEKVENPQYRDDPEIVEKLNNIIDIVTLQQKELIKLKNKLKLYQKINLIK